MLVVGILIVNRNFWFDEAMAYAAITEQGWVRPGQPLAQFEQAMPYGVYLIDKSFASLVGLRENVLRMPGLLAYGLGLFALLRASAVIEGTIGRLAAVAAGGLGMWVVFQAAMLKQYIYEYAAAAVIVWVGLELLRDRFALRTLWAFVAVSLGALFFSNTAPVVTGAAAAAALVTGWLIDRARLRQVLPSLAAAGVSYLAVCAMVFLMVTRPAAVYQLSLPVYGSVGPRSLLEALTRIYAPTGKPAYLVFGVAIGVVILIGAALTARRGARANHCYLILAFAVAALLAGSATGVTPLFHPRHVLFMAPLIGLAFGLATQTIWDALAPARDRSGAVRLVATAVVAVIGAGFVLIGGYAATKRQEEVGRVLAAGDAACDRTYTQYSYQPAAELYVARDRLGIELTGLVPTASGLGHDSWFQKIRDDPSSYQAHALDYFRQHNGDCLLTGPPDGTDLLLTPLAAAGFNCAPVAVLTGSGLYRCRA
jgi:hypothetical protein